MVFNVLSHPSQSVILWFYKSCLYILPKVEGKFWQNRENISLPLMFIACTFQSSMLLCSVLFIWVRLMQIAGKLEPERSLFLLKWVPLNTWSIFIQLQEVLMEHIWHSSLASPKADSQGREICHLTTWNSLLSFFQTTAVYRTGRQKSHSGDISSFYLSEIFLSEVSLFCLPLPGSIQVSTQSSGACTLCRHCTPAACYLRNVVKHLRESMTNTASVTIQKQALEQALISSHPAAPKWNGKSLCLKPHAFSNPNNSQSSLTVQKQALNSLIL